MNAPEPMPFSYWEALRSFDEPLDLMKFTLIYDGDLPASGNSSKAAYASLIRNEFHDQLADLWDSNVILRQLRHTARTQMDGAPWGSGEYAPLELPNYNDAPPALRQGQSDYCAPIMVADVGSFIPLVRNSLYLACALDILFLRHEEPLNLMKQGGDLDGRIKTLFDALRMPNNVNEQKMDLTSDPLYVVLEDDILVSDLSIKTGRLLGARTKKPHTVRLTIDVTVKVLRVFEQNQCLVGG